MQLLQAAMLTPTGFTWTQTAEHIITLFFGDYKINPEKLVLGGRLGGSLVFPTTLHVYTALVLSSPFCSYEWTYVHSYERTVWWILYATATRFMEGRVLAWKPTTNKTSRFGRAAEAGPNRTAGPPSTKHGAQVTDDLICDRANTFQVPTQLCTMNQM